MVTSSTVSSAPNGLSGRAKEIVAVARGALEEEGFEGLSMRRLADRVGVRAPSLYKHFDGKQAIEAALISEGFEELAVAVEEALEKRGDALTAIAKTYRRFAHDHPRLYRLMTERPLARERLVPGVEERAGRPLYEAVGRDAELARAFFAFAHGMTTLELNARFPDDADLDATWGKGIDAFRPGRRRRSRGTGSA